MNIHAAAAALLPFVAAPAQAGNVTSYETKGNLAVTHDLDCIASAQISNAYTPPDLMRAFTKCVHAARYDDALLLFMIAGADARFDTMRVPDATAHDAFAVLMTNATNGESDAEHKGMLASLEIYKDKASALFTGVCAAAARLGPPNYAPDYMTRHGMGAALGGGSAPPADFDAHEAWKKAADSYLHCAV
jgi:hypothetical protein